MSGSADVAAGVGPGTGGGIASRRYRRVTAGLLGLVTLVAFEAMAVGAIMPVTVRDLGGRDAYAWAFTAFLAASLVGVVLAGDWTDRAGPGPATVVGTGLFAGGLVLAGLAPSMPVFIAARAVQGFGGGGVIVPLYVVVARVYPEALHPRVFAAFSTAWVMPAVVGPAAAGAIADAVDWRAVFLALPPLVVPALWLLLPALTKLPSPGRPLARAAASGKRGAAVPGARGRRGRSIDALRLALGTSAVLAAANALAWWSLPVVVAGLLVAAAPLRRLLPPGTLRGRPGLPSVVAARGLLAGSFFGASAFLPLGLTEVRGWSVTAAGTVLTAGAVGWTSGSWLQDRWGRVGVPRRAIVRRSFALVAAGLTLTATAMWSTVPAGLAVLGWVTGGGGMGLGMGSVSVLVLELARPGEQGAATAALSIADGLASVVTTGLGGVALAAGRALGEGTGAALLAFDAAMVGVALVGVALAPRLRRTS